MLRRKRGAADARHDRPNGTAHELLKQRLLVLEVEIKRALGDAGLGGNVVEAGSLVAACGKDRERRIEDGLTPRFRFGPRPSPAARDWRPRRARGPAWAGARARVPAGAAPRPRRLARSTRHGRCLSYD